jgi:outer membrane protein OmpA-like peptidoglycan-associated protein
MAELNVQPKKKNPILWVILAIIALALLFFLIRGCSETKTESAKTDTIAKTVVSWDQVDFNAPATPYQEVTDQGITVRGNDKYTIYGLGENILFAKDQSTIQATGEAQLKQISASLKKRFDGSSLAIFGNTDATGSAQHNRELGAARAKSVREWLIRDGVSGDKITVQSKGESDPVATNATEEGKKLNRSVEIVAMANAAR